MTQSSIVEVEPPKDSAIQTLNRDQITTILGTVTYDKAFFFFEDAGKPTGQYATSLSDFSTKIGKVPAKCLAFHMKRTDFEDWIRDIIGDPELSRRIRDLKNANTTWNNDSTLRGNLEALVLSRIIELHYMWQQAIKMSQAPTSIIPT